MEFHGKFATITTRNNEIYIVLSNKFIDKWSADEHIKDVYISCVNENVSINGTRLGLKDIIYPREVTKDDYNYTATDGGPIPTYEKKTIFRKKKILIKEGTYIKEAGKCNFHSNRKYTIKELSE